MNVGKPGAMSEKRLIIRGLVVAAAVASECSFHSRLLSLQKQSQPASTGLKRIVSEKQDVESAADNWRGGRISSSPPPVQQPASRLKPDSEGVAQRPNLSRRGLN